MRDDIRPPAVAGLFYESDPGDLAAEVGELLAPPVGGRRPAGSWRALLLPHAGHVYSGPICARGVGAVEWPRVVLLMGPNHTGRGRAVALSPSRAWETPLGTVPVHRPLVEALLSTSPAIEPDLAAHASEHSLEVILPFLQVARPDVEVACLAMGAPGLDGCLEVGRAVARAVKRLEAGGTPVAIVVSSDLNHYLPRHQNRQQDLRALDALLSGDPAALYTRVVVKERISMCGVLPATALLEALKTLGPARPRLLAHGDSGDALGETSRVVGYAAVLWEKPAPDQEKE